jgi:hypothetical protein
MLLAAHEPSSAAAMGPFVQHNTTTTTTTSFSLFFRSLLNDLTSVL